MQNDQTLDSSTLHPTTSQTPITFTGNASDYFGIWIVNLLLSIVTLGIYSAWAKVRRKKYFYQNTLIDGVGFDYHANPIAILKGRVIAFVLFVIYNLLAKANPLLGGVLFLLLLLVVPWLVVRGLTFNARNSSHRGLRFDFSANTIEAVKVFMFYPMLVLMTLGLAYPWFLQRLNQFMFNHHRFGLSRFNCEASVKAFYIIYLKLLGLIVVLSVVFAMLISNVTPHAEAETDMESQLPYTQNQAAQLEMTPVERNEMSQAFKKSREQSDVVEDETIKSRIAEALNDPSLGMLMFVILGWIIYITFLSLLHAYIKPRVTNLIWNNTHIDQVMFASSQRMRDVAWLYATNLLALIFSLGLATPWAQIRIARYSLSHLAIVGVADWEQFVGEKKEQVHATGEEIADMFDVDMSFG